MSVGTRRYWVRNSSIVSFRRKILPLSRSLGAMHLMVRRAA
jgi:hypothetical protein